MNALSPFLTMAAAGIVATFALDLWQYGLWRLFGISPTNWTLVGRWIAYIPRGALFHRGIGNAAPIRFETQIGWLTHYLVGLAYAGIYATLALFLLDGRVTMISAMLFALVAVVAPWFFMQPAMGMGVMARNTPKPTLVRVHTFTSHLAFGVGLYIGFQAFPAVAGFPPGRLMT